MGSIVMIEGNDPLNLTNKPKYITVTSQTAFLLMKAATLEGIAKGAADKSQKAQKAAEAAQAGAAKSAKTAKDWNTKAANNAADSLHNAKESEKFASQAKQAASRAIDPIVDMGDFSPATGSYPAKTPYSAIWRCSADATIKGIDWKEGDHLVYSHKTQGYSRLTGSPVTAGKPQPLNVPDDLILSPGHAVRFRGSKTDTDPMYAVGLHHAKSGDKRLVIGDKNRGQQTSLELFCYDANKIYAIEQIKSEADDYEPVERIMMLNEKNGISKKKGGTAEAPIRCTVEPKSDQDLTTKSYVDKGNKKIKDELLDEEWRIYAQTETDLQVIRERNLNQFAASGFVNFGTHVNSAPWGHANDGMFVNSTSSSSLARGKILLGEISNPKGNSKTNHPVTCIAGIISEILGLTDQFGFNSAQILLPDAPDGTTIYDSSGNARGLGKAVLNLKQDIDPKYNDVAQDANEASARAFEGLIVNGDFRRGTYGWSYSNNAKMTVTNGVMTIETNGSTNGQISNSYFGQVSRGLCDVEIYIDDIRGGAAPVLQYQPNSAGSYVSIRLKKGLNKLRLDFSKSGAMLLQPKGKPKGSAIDVHYIFIKPVTEQVVINRVDLFGFEFWLEEVTKAQPHVYPKGAIQSKAKTMNGIPVTPSNRPSTYFDAFPFDGKSTGKGVDFFALSTENKKKVLSDKSNNIFLLSDGRLVQWRFRQRTIAGLGNGDWNNVNSQGVALLFQQDKNNTVQPSAQGALDTTPEWYTPNQSKAAFYGVNHATPVHSENGIFKAGLGGNPVNALAVNGECYWLTLGVISRLNQGAYHPSFNPLGSRTCNGNTNQAVGHYWWHGSALTPRSEAECFRVVDAATDMSTHGAAQQSGYIGTTLLARPDKRFFDQPYESGQGGIIDYRMSAWDMSSKEEAAKVFQKVVNGTYRGLEKLRKTHVFGGVKPTDKGTFSGYAQVRFQAGTIDSTFPQYQKANEVKNGGHFVDSSGNVFVISSVSANSGGFDTVYLSTALGNHSNNIDITGNCYVLPIEELKLSVSGDFTMIDVLGTPENILATKEIANGWVGGWISVIPDGSPQHFPYTKHNIGKVGDGTDAFATTTHGKSWGASSVNTDTKAGNIFGASNQSISAAHVYVIPYIAFAKQTKESANKKPYGSSNGIGEVFASYNYRADMGNTLIESLIGKVATSDWSSSGSAHEFNKVTKHLLHPADGRMGGWTGYDWDVLTHEPISLPKPTNDSPAVKTLWSQSSNNQQATLQFNWNELVWKDYVAPKVDTGAQMVRKRGERYLVNKANSPLNGRILIWRGDDSNIIVDYTAYYIDANNIVRSKSNDTDSTLQLFNGNGWGDDSTIRIKDGIGTLKNLNGDTYLCGTSTLAIDYGFTKNKARAGVQVAGVDV